MPSITDEIVAADEALQAAELRVSEAAIWPSRKCGSF